MTSVRENQDRWLAALRSGEYKQGTNHLHNEDGSMCCLGVAAAIFKPNDLEPVLDKKGYYVYEGAFAVAPDYVQEALGIWATGLPKVRDGLVGLAGLNDAGKTFAEIADIFEANREAYTKEGLL